MLRPVAKAESRSVSRLMTPEAICGSYCRAMPKNAVKVLLLDSLMATESSTRPTHCEGELCLYWDVEPLFGRNTTCTSMMSPI